MTIASGEVVGAGIFRSFDGATEDPCLANEKSSSREAGLRPPGTNAADVTRHRPAEGDPGALANTQQSRTPRKAAASVRTMTGGFRRRRRAW